eukprot:2543770-Prorocentrum_lima.AAC.1
MDYPWLCLNALRWGRGGRKNPMQKSEEIRPVPEEWQQGDNGFSVILIRASPDKLEGRVIKPVEGEDK